MLYRILTLIIKELQSLLRDPKTRGILILMVVLQVVIFPFAATLDVTHARLAIYNDDNGAAAVELTQRLAKSRAFPEVRLLRSPKEIVPTLENQQALLLVRLPADFSRQLASGQPANLQIILDGRRSNSAQIAASYVQQIVQQYAEEQRVKLGLSPLPTAKSQLVIRHWYNPNLNYKWFIVPSLVALITTIGVMIVTSLSVAREREQGTLDQLLVSPLTTWQIFVGKAVPALMVATVQATIVLLFGIFAYKIPFSGSLLLFYSCMLFYGLSLVGFGLLISSLCSTQQQAFIGVFVFMMPAILLSGYISPVENMPVWLQHLTWLNPIRHFTDITKQLYLKDANFSAIWTSVCALWVITFTTGGLAYHLFRRNIA